MLRSSHLRKDTSEVPYYLGYAGANLPGWLPCVSAFGLAKSENLLYDFGTHLEGRCVYPWHWWSPALADGVWGEGGRRREEMPRTAAGFAWQMWPPLSSVVMIKFPKWFWAVQEEWNPCSSLFCWAGGREQFEAARYCKVVLLKILKPPSAYGLSRRFLEMAIWWCCTL